MSPFHNGYHQAVLIDVNAVLGDEGVPVSAALRKCVLIDS